MSFLKYQNLRTPYHNLHPVTKITLFVTFATLAGLLWDYRLLLVLTIISLILCKIAHVPKRWYTYGLTLILLIIPYTIYMALFQTNPEFFKVLPREMVKERYLTFSIPIVGTIGFTYGSLLWFIAMVVRYFAIMFTGLLFVFTTSADSVAHTLLALRIPFPVVYIFSTAMRFIPFLSGIISEVISILKLRGWKSPSLHSNPKNLLQSLPPVAGPFVTSIARLAENINIASQLKAMGSRKYTSIISFNLPKIDLLITSLCTTFFVVMIFLMITLKIGLI